MKKFGQFKSNLDQLMVQSYGKDNFKTVMKEFKKNILSNKAISEMYFIYNDLSSEKGINKEIASEYVNESKDVRLLAYKFLVDKFNEKYKGLTTEQKSVLRNYINNVDNSDNLKRFILRESEKLKKEFSKIKISDKVSAIKLKEVVNLIDGLSNSKIVSENQALGLLRYHQLLNELKGI